MRVGVISDTHDNLVSLQKALGIFDQHKVELIVHCGDWVSGWMAKALADNAGVPVKGVLGNNKGDVIRLMERNPKFKNPVEFPSQGESLVLKLDERSVCVYHGDDKNLLEALIASKLYDAVFTGHTHRVRNEVVDGVFVLNPGATCFVAEGESIPEATVASYDSVANTAEIVTFSAFTA